MEQQEFRSQLQRKSWNTKRKYDNLFVKFLLVNCIKYKASSLQKARSFISFKE